MHQDQLDAEVVRAALDLGEAVGGRGIDAGDELEVEQQIAAFRALLQQLLDVLVEPVGGAEEQIALQVQALDVAAMGQQHVLVVARAVERGAIFRAVETVFDRLDRAALNANVAQPMMTPIRMPGTKPQATMIAMMAISERYSSFESRLRDSDDPFVELVGAEIEQKAADDEFRDEAEQIGRDGSISRDSAATVRPDRRPRPPLEKLRIERLIELQPA